MSESSNENLHEKKSEVIINIDQKPVMMESCRIGRIKSIRQYPVKFSKSSSYNVSQVLQNAKL